MDKWQVGPKFEKGDYLIHKHCTPEHIYVLKVLEVYRSMYRLETVAFGKDWLKFRTDRILRSHFKVEKELNLIPKEKLNALRVLYGK